MNNKIGFIGIGHMGFPMARHLLHAGFGVTVYDKVPEKCEELLREGAKLAISPMGVISPGGTVITMLPNDEALLDIVFGDNGIIQVLSQNEIHISMSTVSPTIIQHLFNAHRQQGIEFISAPVFGRPDTAAAKKIWICTAGAAETKNAVRPILENLGQRIYDFGEEITAANRVKLAGNFLVISAIEAMGEAFAFIEKNGIDSHLFAEMMSQTLFSCPAYQFHAHKIASRTFSPAGFTLALGMKDIQLLMQAAFEINMPMPILSLLYNRFLSALAKDRPHLDWAAITLNTTDEAGITGNFS